jgi:hypothetical protein
MEERLPLMASSMFGVQVRCQAGEQGVLCLFAPDRMQHR